MNRIDFDAPAFDPTPSAVTRHSYQARNGVGREPTDPTASERGYSALETEVFGAIEEYKRSTGREFPTWDEVVGVLCGLGGDKATG